MAHRPLTENGAGRWSVTVLEVVLRDGSLDAPQQHKWKIHPTQLWDHGQERKKKVACAVKLEVTQLEKGQCCEEGEEKTLAWVVNLTLSL